MALNIDWDRSRWLFLPDAFPWHVYEDEAAWIDAISGVYARFGWTAEELSWFGDHLRGLRANNRLGARRFAWIADPRSLLLSLDVFELAHDAALSLDDLSGADGGPRDVREPIVIPVEARGLGSGHRVDRAVRTPRTEHESIGAPLEDVFLLMTWVFRSTDADVLVSVASGQPSVLASAVEDVEAFIDAVELVGESTE